MAEGQGQGQGSVEGMKWMKMLLDQLEAAGERVHLPLEVASDARFSEPQAQCLTHYNVTCEKAMS